MGSSARIVVVGAARTPIGAFLGDFRETPAPALGARAIEAAVTRAGIAMEDVDEVVMGCVLTAGLGQAPARQAALGAGLTDACGAVTINKMCGSGMKAIMLAHDQLVAGSARVMVAGGMESMSNAPYLLDRARTGYRMGHGQIRDHMFLDGLEDAYDKGRLMGAYAEDCATAFQFTRDMQDDYARESLSRAQRATAAGDLSSEIASVELREGKIQFDELPARRAAPERISQLKPAFRENGSVTAANSSAISDGAAALALSTQAAADELGLTPLGMIRGHATNSGPPAQFPTAPIGAIQRVLERVGWRLQDVDLFEINEAFAVVAMAALRVLGAPHDKVNVHGGACALGHPIGASGARIVVTLLAALERYDLRRGVAALCIGGGEATAIAVERQR